jgi:hypothetical protein
MSYNPMGLHGPLLDSILFISSLIYLLTQLRGFSPLTNRPSDRRFLVTLVPTLADKGVLGSQLDGSPTP